MPMDEKETRISSILERAKKWALDLKFARSPGDWFVEIYPKFKEVLSQLDLINLEEHEWSDDVIISILKKLEELRHSPEPAGPSSDFVDSLEDLRRSVLIDSGLLIPDEKLDDIACYISDLIKDRRDREA